MAIDRNVWDPVTPASAVDLLRDGLAVNLCVYSFKNSSWDMNRVRTEVQAAANVWCLAQLNVQAVHWERLPAFAAGGSPFDLNALDLAGQIPCAGISDAGRNQLFAIGRPRCASTDSAKSIAVYCIPGMNLQGGGSGCHQFRVQANQPPEHLILLTDRASGRVLAHELGHALLTRSVSGVWINDDPDAGASVADRSHDVDPQNLMFPNVPANPQITAVQQTTARSSMIVNRQQLAIGFRQTRFKLGVKMRSLNVAWTDDEALSDDALESSWQFRVKTGIVNSLKIYENNRLGSGTHVLPDYLDYPLLDMASDADELVIEVTGKDWDFWSADDVLPPVNKKWKKGTDVWGARSTDPPGGALGDHVDGPHQNNDIKYSLAYTTRVVAEPGEQIFRTVC